MVGGDDLGLLERFEPEAEQHYLQEESGEEEKVVARQCRVVRIEKVRPEQQGQHQGAEQAGPCLLHTEAEEFIQRGRRGVTAHTRGNARLGVDELAQHRPSGRATAACHFVVAQGMLEDLLSAERRVRAECAENSAAALSWPNRSA